MSTISTLSGMRAKVLRDLDLENETFVNQGQEMTDLFNAGIDIVEGIIQKLDEDYFLTSHVLSQVLGTSAYTLPTGIYASKIRGVVYSDGVRVYEVKRHRRWHKFSNIAVANLNVNTAADYMYYMSNPDSSGFVFNLTPTSRETSSTLITVWYLRNATILSADSDVCDIPEHTELVMQYVKYMICKKEGHPNMDVEQALFTAMQQQLVDDLTEMVPDDDNTVEMDVSAYTEQS